MTFSAAPSYYSNVEQVGTMTSNPGGFSVAGSVGGNINNVQGDNNQVTQQNQISTDAGESLKEDIIN